MRRRDFITLLCGAAATWPLAARAQQPVLPAVGFLSSTGPNDRSVFVDRLRHDLAEGGYTEGRNIAIEYRWADDRDERLPDLAADLVRRQVAVIVTVGIPAAKAAQAATATIPIVFLIGGDPVEFGFVPRLNRPGGNITGVSTLSVELTAKRLGLLHEVVPGATSVGLLVDPTNSNAQTLSKDARAAAATLGLQIQILRASTDRDLDGAFADLRELRLGAVVITNTALFNVRPLRLAGLAVRHAIPAIFQYREFAANGGLMSYGDNNGGSFQQANSYVLRILRGEKPGDLPVQLLPRTELIINLKTAKALGLTVPITLLGLADEVIE
jgi:putative ABC transport system substrate-binding protein